MAKTNQMPENITKVGRPTDLTDELFVKIKECVFDGLDIKDTADRLSIPRDTMYGWSFKDYNGFKKKWQTFEQENLLRLAGLNIHKALVMDTTGENDKEDSRLVKIQADVSMWAKETLDKANYSKRTEQTGKDGNAIEHNITGNVIVFKQFTDGTDSKPSI